jgi:hypothetical protein
MEMMDNKLTWTCVVDSKGRCPLARSGARSTRKLLDARNDHRRAFHRKKFTPGGLSRLAPGAGVICLPALQHDPNRPEDVLKIDADEDGIGGDDAADSLRYLVATKSRAVTQRKLRGL